MSFQDLSNAERIQRIKSFLEGMAPDQQLESAREQLNAATGSGSGEQLETMGGGDSEALETLDVMIRHGDKANVTGQNLDRLEAIIHKKGRPAIDIVNDSFNAPSGEWQILGAGETKKRIENAIPSIGRIEVPNDLRPYAGTGFVVGKNLLMTNRHVAKIFALGIGEKNLKFDSGQVAAVDFKREIPRRSSPDPVLLNVTKIRMIHPYWDMALLEVSGLPEEHAPLQLSVTAPEEMIDQKVVVIGYPAFDERSNRDVQNDIFDRIYEVKRLLPGKLTGRSDYVQLNGEKRNVASHDSSTLGGNSGSTVVNIDTGEVVALHFAGVYLKTNYAVSMLDLAQDTRVVDAGVNFSGRLEPRSDFYGPIWAKTDANESIAASPSLNLQGPSSSTATSITSTAASGVEITIPLNISVSVGTPVGGASTASAPAAASSPVSPDTSSEGLFSSGPDANDFISRFSHSSLTAGSFDWDSALSTALGSHVAYLEESEVKDTTLRKWGFDSCRFIHADNTECFVAATADAVLVAFRGTEASIADWLTDLNAFSTSRLYGRVHTGFLAGFQAVDSQLRAALALDDFSGRPLVLTGHSLGGALATIAAAEWKDDFQISSIYTFGQPGVGKGRFPAFISQNFGDRFYRFVNDDDIIPMVPPTYPHVGQLFHLDSSGNLPDSTESVSTESVIDDEGESRMLTEVQFDRLRAQLLAARIRQSDGSQPTAEEGLLPSFSDHRLVNYIVKIARHAS